MDRLPGSTASAGAAPRPSAPAPHFFPSRQTIGERMADVYHLQPGARIERRFEGKEGEQADAAAATVFTRPRRQAYTKD